MLLSLITPTYNRASFPYLRDLCTSVAIASQYGKLEIEHLIVNDGSTDDTEAQVLALRREYPSIRYLKHTENLGITRAKNHALREARGELIVEVDDDDLLPFYSLVLRVNRLLESQCAWLYGNAFVIDEQGTLCYRDNLLSDVVPVDRLECFRAFYEDRLFANASTRIYRREALETIQGWNERICSLCEDFDLWLRLTYAWGAPAFCEIPLVFWRRKKHSLGIDAVRSGAYEATLAEIKSWYTRHYEEALTPALVSRL